MTNPDNALGTNGAFGGRTSVNAFNDVLATFDGAGVVSGFAVAPDTGMTVEVGGSGTVRDVAVAEDPFGNRTTVDNISGDPIPVTIDTASTTTARIDSIVAYVNSPANASDTTTDNPTACGIISVNGTSGGAPTDAAIRTAITTDGGTGSTAYYVVIANVSVPANTTTITSGLISAGKSINLSNAVTTGSNGLMLAADKTKLDGINKTTLDNLFNYSTSEKAIGTWTDGKPLYRKVCVATSITLNQQVLVENIPDVNDVARITAVQRSTTGFSMPVPTIWQGDLTNRNSMVWVDVKQTGGEVKYEIKSGWTTAAKLTIIVEYTKTTD